MLGRLADHFGLHVAFAIEPVLIGACALLLLAGMRLGVRDGQLVGIALLLERWGA